MRRAYSRTLVPATMLALSLWSCGGAPVANRSRESLPFSRNDAAVVAPAEPVESLGQQSTEVTAPPESVFVTPEQAYRNTVGGELLITELSPGEAYEVRLGNAVLFRTSASYLMDHPAKYRGVIPHVVAAFLNVRPFEEVLVLRWESWGNVCETSEVSFVGINRDGRPKVINVDVCTMEVPTVDSNTEEIRLIIPPEPPGMRHGGMHPLIPGDEYRLKDGRLLHVRKLVRLLPYQAREAE